MVATASAILTQLGHSGRRRTSPRREVIAAALRRREPFAARQLIGELARRGVGRATVFRTLDLLVSLGALSRLHGVEGGVRCVRYTPCAPSHHHHLVCQACGRVEELAPKVLDQRITAMARSRGFEPLGHTVEIVGLCPECRA
ncbi:MAG TPA: Fur family transcriptional regulator [Candidatus Limnocylindria bacterium]